MPKSCHIFSYDGSKPPLKLWNHWHMSKCRTGSRCVAARWLGSVTPALALDTDSRHWTQASPVHSGKRWGQSAHCASVYLLHMLSGHLLTLSLYIHFFSHCALHHCTIVLVPHISNTNTDCLSPSAGEQSRSSHQTAEVDRDFAYTFLMIISTYIWLMATLSL